MEKTRWQNSTRYFFHLEFPIWSVIGPRVGLEQGDEHQNQIEITHTPSEINL